MNFGVSVRFFEDLSVCEVEHEASRISLYAEFQKTQGFIFLFFPLGFREAQVIRD